MKDNIKITDTEILSDDWSLLKKITFESAKPGGQKVRQTREVFDRGHAATILLYNPETGNIILTKQFRLPAYLNGDADGYLVETCAGMLDGEAPEDCIKRETEEETGYRVSNVQKICEAYMSPGAVTEVMHFFVATYSPAMKANDGGGVAHEQEEIEVIELSFQKALKMIETGEIRDAKTILLLYYARAKNLL